MVSVRAIIDKDAMDLEVRDALDHQGSVAGVFRLAGNGRLSHQLNIKCADISNLSAEILH
jgi:hypothetical protein